MKRYVTWKLNIITFREDAIRTSLATTYASGFSEEWLNWTGGNKNE